MISIFLRESDDTWFGVACKGEVIVATTVSANKASALRSLLKSLPRHHDACIVERLPDFAERIVLAIQRLHSGLDEPGAPASSFECHPELRAAVLRVAARIPAGYVASYGAIAKIAGAEPKEVGRIMASNPLYPIVPCHRVVGADFSLVGYGGGRGLTALRAKLARLYSERRSFRFPKDVQVEGAVLRVHPVEWVIEKARRQGIIPTGTEQSIITSYWHL